MRTVSIKALADAIDLNGYPIAKKALFRSDNHPGQPDNKIVVSDEEWASLPPGTLLEACALGQAALNLGIGANELCTTLVDGELTAIRNIPMLISMMNDQGKTPKQIARWLRKEYKDFLNHTVELPEFDYGSLFSNYQGVKL